MSSTGFIITSGGQAEATVANPGGPYIHITEFRVGSSFNYTPSGYVPGVSPPSQTDILGTLLYSSAPQSYTVVDDDTVELMLLIPPTEPSFSFGEVGIYLEDGTLFAICVFDTLQQHVHAVGNQAGTIWKIRARIKLAQIPAICQITLINSQTLLEVPNWQSLLAPVNQPSGANAAIVHDNNSSGDPVFVVRDGDLEWAPVGYKQIFTGSVSDSGASSTILSFVHPNLNQVMLEMPSTTSKYLAKFSDGSVRRVVGNSTSTSVQWTPALGLAPTGTITLWKEPGNDDRIAWADTIEYNLFITSFNPYWTTPTGSFSTTNKGLNQSSFAALARRTETADWTALLNAVRAVARIHGVSVTDLASATNFIYSPIGPTPYGLETLRLQWQALLNKITAIDAARLTFDDAFQDFLTLFTHTDSTYFTTRNYDFTFDTSSVAHRNALLNGGMRLALTMDVTSPVDLSWVALDALFAQIGTLTIFDDSVSRSGPGGGGSETFFTSTDGLYLLANTPTLTDQYEKIHAASGWRCHVSGQYNGSGDIVIRVQLTDTITPYVYGGSPGTINFSWVGSRPTSAQISTPVLAFPTVSVVQS